jgi:hypothetical protein
MEHGMIGLIQRALMTAFHAQEEDSAIPTKCSMNRVLYLKLKLNMQIL